MEKYMTTGVYTRNGVEKTFNFYTNLKASDKLGFVDSVVDLVVGNSYNSIIRNMMFDFMVIRIFTDIDVSNIVAPDNDNAIDMIEDLLEETNIVSVVKANVEDDVIEELEDAVDKAVEYRTGIHKNPIADALASLLNTLNDKAANIDTENMMKAVNAISEMSDGLTSDKIVEAYTKSDAFKKNHK